MTSALKKWKLGDVVRLASGGPAMTVQGVGRSGKAEAAWFVGGEVRTHEFSEDSLVAADVTPAGTAPPAGTSPP